MQSNKSSSRRPKATAESSVTTPEVSTTAPAPKARKAKTSSPKADATQTSAPAKRHRKTNAVADTQPGAAAVAAPSSAVTTEVGEPPRTMAAAAGAGSFSYPSDVVESVGALNEPVTIASVEAPVAASSQQGVDTLREEIAKLAYFYWEARGYQHGSHEEDWFRAERELKASQNK